MTASDLVKVDRLIADETAKEQQLVTRKNMELLLTNPPLLPSEIEEKYCFHDDSAAESSAVDGLSEMVRDIFDFQENESVDVGGESMDVAPSEEAPAPPPRKKPTADDYDEIAIVEGDVYEI
jgi:hypothetical protein